MATATPQPSHAAPLRSEAGIAIPARGILVVDDHELVRLGLRALLLAETGSVPVYEARSLADALHLYELHLASHFLVLLDLDLPDAQGLDTLVRFKRAFPASRVVVLSGKDSHALMQGAMALGAQAFLPKTGHLGEVLRYVRDNDLVGLPARPLVDAPSPVHAKAAVAELQPQLNARQVEILDWLLAGKSNKEIAQLSRLTEGTVKNHVSTLLLLFGMRSRAQLISSLR
ncbi:DNA-binding NarL/FixJ family response regulator [Variovorax boronicumulans]|uniref:DNA-binding NarL/FixJ family response regulator n=1 Tax=Variovorax boronicumulans TaxID=436515 RepID=A0AAW8DYK4_9BURK|nr:response regulator transcription factor [Variovorax boronicumulans]MDP9879200.1 DNA-binding NarL/FixJ family response regulator [Variovorax boronicumulans]MDP9924484.1 DNA-binding NarL/FixJ family response regulator [Variovorax boronicumulans]